MQENLIFHDIGLNRSFQRLQKVGDSSEVEQQHH